ncbi:formylglycine-generating enzyme family protein [Thermodesulfobacteriota bacterium]
MNFNRIKSLTMYLFVFTLCSLLFPFPVHAASPSGTDKKISNSLGMEFVYIKPGTFMMGSPLDEPGRNWNEKQHRVTLTKGFYMQTTEVTQGQWQAVMGGNPSYFKNCGDDCPVEKVSWNDAQEFIRKLNRREGGNAYRLPTEAQWEYAARAGSSTAFANGGITELKCGYDGKLDAMGWYCGNSGVNYNGCFDGSGWGGPKCAGTHKVAQKQANAWGLYDMHGNVWEWCQNWYKKKYPSGSVTDPTGPSSGSHRVSRGGGWLYRARSCRSANRDGYRSGYRRERLGFRLALSPGQ